MDGIDTFLVASGDLALTFGASPVTYELQKRITPEIVQAKIHLAIATHSLLPVFRTPG